MNSEIYFKQFEDKITESLDGVAFKKNSNAIKLLIKENLMRRLKLKEENFTTWWNDYFSIILRNIIVNANELSLEKVKLILELKYINPLILKENIDTAIDRKNYFKLKGFNEYNDHLGMLSDMEKDKLSFYSKVITKIAKMTNEYCEYCEFINNDSNIKKDYKLESRDEYLDFKIIKLLKAKEILDW